MSTPNKSQIKDWMKRCGHSREWLGERCGKSKNTVNNWLSTNIEIPTATLHLIARLMEDDEREEAQRHERQGSEMSHVTLRITTDELNEWSKAFKSSPAATLEDWAIEAIRAAFLEDQEQGESPQGPTPLDFADPAEMARAVEREHQQRESARRKTRQAKDG